MHIGNVKIVILWEHEIITAAKALECFRRDSTMAPPTSEEMRDAIVACMAALSCPELSSGKYPITIMSAKSFKKDKGGK